MSKITQEFYDNALRHGFIIRSKKNTETSESIILASVIEMYNLGYLITPKELQGMSVKELEKMVQSARKIIGADRNMEAVYPGFPQQVEELDTLQLITEQILHYWTNGQYLPNHPTIIKENISIEEINKNARKAEVVYASDIAQKLVKKITTQSIAMSPNDKNLIESALYLYNPSIDEIVEIVKKSTNGENIQTFIKNIIMTQNSIDKNDLFVNVVQNIDNLDYLLRVILTVYGKARDGSDLLAKDYYVSAVEHLRDSLARFVNVGSIPRRVRRMIIERMNELSVGFHADVLVKRIKLWRRVMISVHPYDFVSEDNRRAVDIIHENIVYKTFNSYVEEYLSKGNIVDLVELLKNNQPGNLLRRLVAILRMVSNDDELRVLVDGVREVGDKVRLTTLISTYNGVISANDSHTRVLRIAGFNNVMLEKDNKKIDELYVGEVLSALEDSLMMHLAGCGDGMVSEVGVLSDGPVALVRRDASISDRVLDRGEILVPAGDGDVLRFFGHWNNNMTSDGYMDIGVVVLDDNCEKIAVSTWNSWMDSRDWSTYSGDKLVIPGDSAAEYVDVYLDKLLKNHSRAKYIAFTVQSWMGWKICDVDFIAGLMYRHDNKTGDVFDPRTVATAFTPTTQSTQAVPLVYDIQQKKMIWIDSSNGSNKGYMSSAGDDTIGSVVYDELKRPRLTMGDLAKIYAKANNIPTTNKPVDKNLIHKILEK